MVEPIGLTIGVVGLAGLFGACVQCFDMVQTGRAQRRDFELLHTKLDVQRVRFLAWGEAAGLINTTTYNDRFDHPAVRPTVERVLRCIRLLFKEGNELTARYGLRRDTDGMVTATGNPVGAFRTAFARFNA